MFRWVNRIIEFMDVAEKMSKIGIIEIENKSLRAEKQMALIDRLKQSDRLFKRLGPKQEEETKTEMIEDFFSDYGSEEASDEYSMNFESESSALQTENFDVS